MNKNNFPKIFAALIAGGALTLVLLWGLSGQAAAASPAQPAAAIRYVAPNGADTGDCLAPDAPCASIQYAVDAAADGDEIRIAAVEVELSTPPITATSHYVGTGESVISITKNLTLRGGYVYTHSSILPLNTWGPSPIPALVDGENARRGLYVSGDVTVTVRLLAFTQGYAERGGNIYAKDASLVLAGTPIISGTATYGGGMYLENCETAFDPGEILPVLLADSSGMLPVAHNSATFGGGIYIEGGSPLLTSLGIFQNQASTAGGGIYIHQSRPVLGLNIIAENHSDSGGGAYLDQSAAKILGAAIISNTAVNGAGLYIDGPLSLNPADAPLIANAYVRHNAATASGGGFYFSAAVAGLLNNVVADNSAAEGAGMYLRASSPQVYHNTVAQNTGASGIYVTHKEGQIWPPKAPIPSYPAFTNTMVVSHSIGLYVDSTGLPSPLQNRAQLEGTLWSGNTTDMAGAGDIVHTGDVFGDPRFTCTSNPPDCINPYHILTDSAALDSGVVPGLFSDYSLMDIDLQPRPSGNGYDIGADEIISDTYGVWLVPPISAKSAAPGEVVTHTHTLLNSGQQTDTYDLELHNYVGTATLVATSPITLSPGATATVMVRVPIPFGADNGEVYRSVITATSRTAAASRAYALDLTAVLTQTTVDLQIRKTAERTTAYGGEAIRYTLTITRQGALTASQAVTITDQVDPPEALDAWRIPSACEGNGASGAFTCTLTLPPFTGVETHTLSVVLTTTQVYTGLLVNQVTVAGNHTADPDPDNNQSYALVGVRNPPSGERKIYLPLILR